MARRYDHFQIMRGVACLMVFLNHVVGLLSASLDFKTWYGPFIYPMGFLWVWLFLILSGFLLTKQFVTGRASLDVPGILRFYGRRSRRLLPMLWFAPVLFGLLFSVGLWSPGLPTFSPLRELGVALALPWIPYATGNPIASVNSPVWSAVLEVHYFLLLPILLKATKLSLQPFLWILGAWLAGVALLALIIFRTGEPTIFPMIYQQHLYNAGFMLAGCALALIPRRVKSYSLLWPIGAAAAFLIAAPYVSMYNFNLSLALLPLVSLPAFSWLVLRSDADFQSPVPKNAAELELSRGPLRWIELAGMMSYSIYLLHKPLSYIVIYQLGLAERVAGLSSCYAMTILTAMLISPVIVAAFILVELRHRNVPAHQRLVLPSE